TEASYRRSRAIYRLSDLLVVTFSGSQRYSMYRAVSVAAFSPSSRPTTYSDPSIPADTPAVVTTLPLSTIRLSAWTVAFGAADLSRSIDPQCVVASLPSSRPAFASRNAPVQTDIVTSVSADAAFTHSITFGSLSGTPVEPPGRTMMSGFGQSAR